MQGVDRCSGYLVSCLVVKRKKREATHSADYCKSSGYLHSIRRSWDLEVLLRSADAERERRTDSRCLLTLSGEAEKARRRRDEAAGTRLAEAEVAAVTVTVTEAATATATAAAMSEGCLVAAARYDSFHLVVAARFAEDNMQVVAASLESIWVVVRYVPWALVPVQGTDCSLCGCDKGENHGGGASARASFLEIFGLVLVHVPALYPCSAYVV
jgi:hypothetical protein